MTKLLLGKKKYNNRLTQLKAQ